MNAPKRCRERRRCITVTFDMPRGHHCSARHLRILSVTAALVICSSIALLAAEPGSATSGPVPMVVALRQMDDAWRTIEPQLFAADHGKKHIGDWVRCRGSPLSLQPPITIKLASGTTIRLTKLQGGDRKALASFRKPPFGVTVWGPIIAIDPATRTVIIKAVSTMFQQ